MKNFEYCKYTYLHRIALKYYIEKNEYLTEEERRELLKRAEVHDMDKMSMYLYMDKKQASDMHRKFAHHHIKEPNNIYTPTEMDYLESIFDYECAGLTKPDKPLNAYDTVLKYYPQYQDIYMPLLHRLHMDSSYVAFNDEDLAYISQFEVTEKDISTAVFNFLNTRKHNIFKDVLGDDYERLIGKSQESSDKLLKDIDDLIYHDEVHQISDK